MQQDEGKKVYILNSKTQTHISTITLSATSYNANANLGERKIKFHFVCKFT